MDYKRNSLDEEVLALLQGESGDDVRNRLDKAIREQEQQLNFFKAWDQLCDAQINSQRIKATESICNERLEKDRTNAISVYSDFKFILNIQCYIVTLSMDIKSTQKSLYFEKLEWCRRNAARQMCTLLYEACCDIPELFGKQFWNLITNRVSSDVFKNKYKSVRKKINKYTKDNEGFFKTVRNNASAHRDNNAFKQISVTENINWLGLAKKVLEFEDITKLFAKITLEVKDAIENQNKNLF